MNPELQNASARRDPEPVRRVPCGEIQDLLFDYMSRELGDSRSALVREHLRKCAACQASAAEIQSTLDALRDASRAPAGVPEQLSRERRDRIVWALAHPVRDWVYRHHVLVSALVALLILAAVLAVFRVMRFWEREQPEPLPTVTIGTPPGSAGSDGTKGAEPWTNR